MQELIILGAGTFAVEVTDLIEDIGGFEILGYLVNREGNVSVDKMLSWEDLSKHPHARVVGAMVSTDRAGFISQVLRLGFKSLSLVHPSASVSKRATILPGAIIGRQVAIGCHATIGSFAIVNRSASIGHHSLIGPFSTIGPGANIAGQVDIESGVMVGMGATVIERLIIGRNARIAAGSVVLANVKGDTKVMGNPAMEY